jgi:hypothetical protein
VWKEFSIECGRTLGMEGILTEKKRVLSEVEETERRRRRRGFRSREKTKKFA